MTSVIHPSIHISSTALTHPPTITLRPPFVLYLSLIFAAPHPPTQDTPAPYSQQRGRGTRRNAPTTPTACQESFLQEALAACTALTRTPELLRHACIDTGELPYVQHSRIFQAKGRREQLEVQGSSPQLNIRFMP